MTSQASHVPFREFADGEVVPGTRYRICGLIGQGGMGSVYEVEHVELGKRFVLKALLRKLAGRSDLVARLRNEWRALGRLNHPSIVNVTDAGTSTNGVPFYVMERLDGDTLADRLRRQGRLPVDEALEIAAAVIDALSAAHAIGIVHRDVKPPNVFCVRGGGVKLLDFGIAKFAHLNAEVITQRNMAVGTPRYMSPEQAAGEKVDGRTDLYSAGLMLFEMVAGCGPFDDVRDPNKLLLAHLSRVPPALSSFAPGIADELDQIVAQLLAKDPRQRPPSAQAVAATLGDLASRYTSALRASASPPAAAATPRRGGGRSQAAADATRPEAPRSLKGSATVAATPQAARASHPPEDRTAVDPAFGHTESAPPPASTNTLVDPPLSGATTELHAASSRPIDRTQSLEELGALPFDDPPPTRTAVPPVAFTSSQPPRVPTASGAAFGRAVWLLGVGAVGVLVLAALGIGAWWLVSARGATSPTAGAAPTEQAAPAPPARIAADVSKPEITVLPVPEPASPKRQPASAEPQQVESESTAQPGPAPRPAPTPASARPPRQAQQAAPRSQPAPTPDAPPPRQAQQAAPRSQPAPTPNAPPPPAPAPVLPGSGL